MLSTNMTIISLHINLKVKKTEKLSRNYTSSIKKVFPYVISSECKFRSLSELPGLAANYLRIITSAESIRIKCFFNTKHTTADTTISTHAQLSKQKSI